MPAHTLRLLLIGLVVGASISAVTASEKLTLRVSREVINTREGLTVRAVVAPDASNRVIGIQADSGEFFRSSQVEMDGERAPRVFELPLHSLPSGDYTVIAVLINDKGERTTVQKSFRVMSFGDDR
jgi:predicted phage tail protein